MKIRIAVAVDFKGAWHACGWDGADDETLMSSTLDSLEEGESRYWVEVEVEKPVREEKVISAVATPEPQEGRE